MKKSNLVAVTDAEGEQNKHARRRALHIRGATAALKLLAVSCILQVPPRLPQPFYVC